MFFILRCAIAVGLIYFLSPLRKDDAALYGRPTTALDGRDLVAFWRVQPDEARARLLEALAREAATEVSSRLRPQEARPLALPSKP